MSIIKHLDDDNRFCQLNDPGRQFYAGVPIRSPNGINIGVYCVFDDKPRPQGLSADEVRFIREISRVVMDYLESKRSHEWYRREQRMVRGLGSFVKGEATLWKWAEEASEHRASFQDLPGMSEGFLNKSLQTATPAAATQQQQHQSQNQAMSPDSEAPIADDKLTGWRHHGRGDGKAAAATTPRSKTARIPEASNAPVSESKPAQRQTGSMDSLRGNIDRVFSKAANVIRESIEVEGVLFLNANLRSHSGLAGNIPSEPPSPFDGRHSSSSGPSSGDDSPRHPTCDVLGFSTSHGSSIVGDTIPSEFTGCRETFLQRLLRRFPLGQVWNFEADGTVSDHSTSSESDDPRMQSRKMSPPPPSPPGQAISDSARPPVRSQKRLNTAAQIIKMFPGARSVAMVPLWDAQTGNWFAGAFAWTRVPTRTLTDENELTYLRVFGLTAMAEVARLKMRAADKAKMDILGSISHELRSPLHGLLGTIELLRDTALNALQDGILRTIEASGRTLLDTIDHVSNSDDGISYCLVLRIMY